MSPRAPIPVADLPLKPDVFIVLLILLNGDRHGYAIMQEAAERTAGKINLQPGALYRLLKRLLDEDLVEEVGDRPVGEGDERRRYYRITSFGRRTAAAEAQRMAELVRASAAHDLLDDLGVQ